MKLQAYTATLAPHSKQLVQAHAGRVASRGGTGVDRTYLERVVKLFQQLGVWDNLRVGVSPRFGYDLVDGKASKLYNLKKGDCTAPSETMRGTPQANAVKGHTQLAGTSMGYFGKSLQPIRNNNITVYQVFQVNSAIYVGLFGLLWNDADTDTIGEYTLLVDRRTAGQVWSASRGSTNSFTTEGKVVPFSTLNGSAGLVILCHKMRPASSYFRNLAGSAESESFQNLYNAEFRNYALYARTKTGFALNGRFVDSYVFHGVHSANTEAAIYNFLLSEYNNT